MFIVSMMKTAGNLLKPWFSARRFSSEIFVTRLSGYTTNEELIEMFSPFGVVTQARLIKDPKTQRPKGFGFVKFESEVDAEKALKAMNGRVLSLTLYYDPQLIVRGRLIFVEIAKTTRPGEDATC
ncbi:Small RNA-binding protein 11, chloroplastic [Vitis vinifera]|uniref:Small RNA-binding protein 11, chloroplastic n=1 Tax=Vitis vinifera TaxID=29760 RepID=A0A438FAN6_VITVI|nr:Small RNA-binding protein 11, chloroplastic [Vitis vinifera]